ncbi:MAG: glutamate--tRNA ligase [Alphaproteobacteria bacterium]
MSIKVRFAPSPTGNLHVGNLRTALLNKLLSLSVKDGIFMLRLDDTDVERSKKEYEDNIRTDLEWLGLNWQQMAKQSERMGRYEQVFDDFCQKELIYPCYETSEELEYKRRRLLTRGLPPVYDRGALQLSDEQVKAYEAEGRKPHFRFKLPDEPMIFHDLVRGEQKFESGHISDPVVRRADGSFLYMLPSVIDDVDFNITHIIRGEDHTSNTALQLPMFTALGAEPPKFAHLPLMVGEDGGKLSKRIGSLGILQLREQGMEAEALNIFLTDLGSSQEAHSPTASLNDLAADFDLGHYARNTPRFDATRLWALNAHIVQELEWNDVKERLADLPQASEEFWHAVRANCAKVSEAASWHEVVFGHITPMVDSEDKEFIQQAAELLPAEPYDENSWSIFTTAVKEASGRKGKNLFMPLRKAITGLEHGPELKYMLPLIGRDKAHQRLSKS